MSQDIASLRFDGLIAREWLALSGNGSYASSTLPGVNTRKTHGLLVAAMGTPERKMVLLSRVEETVRLNGKPFELAANEYPGTIHPNGHQYLRAFSNVPYPRWGYQADGWTLEKQLRLLPGQATVVLSYTLLGGATSIEIEIRPLFALRGISELMYQWNAPLEASNIAQDGAHWRLPATSRTPEVFFAHNGRFANQSCWYLNTIYRREQEQGHAGLEDLWMPGVVRYGLGPGQTVHLVCSNEPIDLMKALSSAQAFSRQAALTLKPTAGRAGDEALVDLAVEGLAGSVAEPSKVPSAAAR